MNKTIETIFNHRSIRKFTNKKLSEKQIHTLISAAQQASTSSHVMAYSIIGITDEAIKRELAEISGQTYVKDNGHLFIFCGDLYRINQQASPEEQAVMQTNMESTEQFIVAIIDATLAAQNTVIAAESIGLGICFIGSIRNNIQRTNDLLALPDHVVPLFGLVVGYPDQQPESKPRLPVDVVYHENKYTLDEKKQQSIESFDQELKTYYQNRSANMKSDIWTEQMIRKYKHPIRTDVAKFIKDKHFNTQ